MTEGTGKMKSPLWWLRHDGIGRSRLFVLVLAVLLVIVWAVFGWPATETTIVIAGLSVILAIGDYIFWRRDLRKAEKTHPAGEE